MRSRRHVLGIVLAGGDVLLFPADAQVGNWLSWQDLDFRVKEADSTRRVTGPQLLSRTVFFSPFRIGARSSETTAAPNPARPPAAPNSMARKTIKSKYWNTVHAHVSSIGISPHPTSLFNDHTDSGNYVQQIPQST
jgi:hypothetical protein